MKKFSFFDPHKLPTKVDILVAKAGGLAKELEVASALKLKLKMDEIRVALSKPLKPVTKLEHMATVFALIREASTRVLGIKHYDVQLKGGYILAEGGLAEMKTGEGKTFVIPLAAIWAWASGHAVHVVTANEYLATRDANLLEPLYAFFGVTVGIILSGQSIDDKKQVYAKDVIYGVNSEFGFDYLRDNMALTLGDKVQNALDYAIIDEADNILIDEARTPLIIAGQEISDLSVHVTADTIVRTLEKELDYTVDEKVRQTQFTESGFYKVEQALLKGGQISDPQDLYRREGFTYLRAVQHALTAHTLYIKDKNYVIDQGKIEIVDEGTGRILRGRRWSDGLHQAVEVKEQVAVQDETVTKASITYQNFFHLYKKLAGLTGTALTEEAEFLQVYGLRVYPIPTHKPVIRKDHTDLVFATKIDKYRAILEDIKARHKNGQPILIGTPSVRESEEISKLLTDSGLGHIVLNAKNNTKEAEIIAEAGAPFAITISTNMAGRGTDIMLGGNLEHLLKTEKIGSSSDSDNIIKKHQSDKELVIRTGGLFVLATARHESRRVDNQLQGRAGRQGDPGESQFYLSAEDELLRVFGGDIVKKVMGMLSLTPGEPIALPMMGKSVAKAQMRLEDQNFQIRKSLVKLDSVLAQQRKIVYGWRDAILRNEYVLEGVAGSQLRTFTAILSEFIPENTIAEQWDLPALKSEISAKYGVVLSDLNWDTLGENLIKADVLQQLHNFWDQKVASDLELYAKFAQVVTLTTLDAHWQAQMTLLDQMRSHIHLRAYANQKPEIEYEQEAFRLFEAMLVSISEEITEITIKFTPRRQSAIEAEQATAQPVGSGIGGFKPKPMPAILNKPESPVKQVITDKLKTAEAPAALALLSQSEQRELPRPRLVITVKSRIWGGTQTLNFYDNPIAPTRNSLCECGSGMRYKHCHGRLTK